MDDALLVRGREPLRDLLAVFDREPRRARRRRAVAATSRLRAARSPGTASPRASDRVDRQEFGWFSLPAACASCSKRRKRSGSREYARAGSLSRRGGAARGRAPARLRPSRRRRSVRSTRTSRGAGRVPATARLRSSRCNSLRILQEPPRPFVKFPVKPPRLTVQKISENNRLCAQARQFIPSP